VGAAGACGPAAAFLFGQHAVGVDLPLEAGVGCGSGPGERTVRVPRILPAPAGVGGLLSLQASFGG
jgi:hypothetical protein